MCITHRRSVAVLCMLLKTSCNNMHPDRGALPVSYVPVRVVSSAMVSHLYICGPPCWRISQDRIIFILLSVSPLNDPVTSYSMV